MKRGRSRFQIPEEYQHELCTVEEAAQELGVVTGTVYYYLSSGHLKEDNRFGIKVVIRSSVEQFKTANAATG